jgi:hypothetical protein
MWGAAVVMPAAPCFLPEIQASSAAEPARPQQKKRRALKRAEAFHSIR